VTVVVAPVRDRLTLIPVPHVGEDPVGRYCVANGTGYLGEVHATADGWAIWSPSGRRPGGVFASARDAARAIEATR
jgi:hypothetical protein